MTTEKKLARTQASVYTIGNPYGKVPFSEGGNSLMQPYSSDPFKPVLNGVPGTEGATQVRRLNARNKFQNEVEECRHFYRYDPLVSTVINRMVDMANGPVKNRRGSCSEVEIQFYKHIAGYISDITKDIMLEYLLTGVAVVDHGFTRAMGTKLGVDNSRKRYYTLDPLWVRNTENILLKRQPATQDRAVFIVVPQYESSFIQNKGVYPDGSEDKERYNMLVARFPRYIKSLSEGKTEIRLDHVMPITRKQLSSEDFPQPFLSPVLSALKHKWRIKQMDYSLATRAINGILHVAVGSDSFPTTEDDPAIEEIRQQMATRPTNTANQEPVYTLYTNHTVNMKWVYPPLDALLSEEKYREPNAEILMGLGFPQKFITGESARSNAGGSSSSTGPIATLEEMRRDILKWVRYVYKLLAELNGFENVPEPYFPRIPNEALNDLIRYALVGYKSKLFSQDTIYQMFGTNFEDEYAQQTTEKPLFELLHPALEMEEDSEDADSLDQVDDVANPESASEE